MNISLNNFKKTGYNSSFKFIVLPLLLFIFLIIFGGVIYLNNKKNYINRAITMSTSSSPASETIAEGLDTPWAITFLPNMSILVTEREGRVRLIDETGKLQVEPAVKLTSVKEIGEGGLLGITLHPDFHINNYVYLYYTYSKSGNNTLNRIVRMVYKDNKLSDEKIIVDNIPGASNHNGGRIRFGPDKYLYITTGDAQDPSRSQEKNSLAGKILRITDEGQAAPGNPFTVIMGPTPNQNQKLIYSLGHRNPQGIAWDSNGNLWATEHGRSGIQSGLDELNLIEYGKNYGWPIIQGDEIKEGMEIPKLNSGPNNTWAPAGTVFVGDSIYFGGLRGQALYKAVIQDDKVVDLKEYFKGQFGRIREVIKGPDNMLYITTSNKDGRGNPASNDDRIIKINPIKL